MAKTKPTRAGRGRDCPQPLTYYCQLKNGHLQAIDYSGGSLLEGNKKNARTPRIYRFLRYTEAMLERRSKWTDDLPDWWKG